MKRRVRLFSAIASLCVALALMAFGVYAATAVSYTVNGSVTYTVDQALVTVNTTAFRTNSVKGYKDVAQNDLEGAFDTDLGDTPTSVTVTNSRWSNVDTNKVPTGETSNDSAKASLDIKLNDGGVYMININVKNEQTADAVTLSATPSKGTATNFEIVAAADNVATVAAGDNVDLVFYVYLLDPTIAVSDAAEVSIVLEMTRA